MNQAKIGEFRNFDDWGLYLKSGWTLSSPSVKRSTIDMPAADGLLDLTETLASEPRYGNRRFSCTLIFPPFKVNRKEYELKRRLIANYCHGKKMHIQPPDNPWRYLIGRCQVSELNLLSGHAEIVITADCEPWLYKNKITHLKLAVDGELNIVLRKERKTVLPEIITDNQVDVTINDITHTITAGSTKNVDFLLKEGRYQCKVVGNANVEIKYQEATL